MAQRGNACGTGVRTGLLDTWCLPQSTPGLYRHTCMHMVCTHACACTCEHAYTHRHAKKTPIFIHTLYNLENSGAWLQVKQDRNCEIWWEFKLRKRTQPNLINSKTQIPPPHHISTLWKGDCLSHPLCRKACIKPNCTFLVAQKLRICSQMRVSFDLMKA